MIARRLILSVPVTLGALAFASAPALAAGPEAPETLGPPTGVTATTATFHGVLNPHGTASTKAGWYFAYSNPGGSSCSEGPATVFEAEVEGRALAVETNPEVAGLEPAREYKFCLVATNELGQFTRGNEESFETAALAPSLTESSESALWCRRLKSPSRRR